MDPGLLRTPLVGGLGRRPAFDPWLNVAGWEAVAHIPGTVARAPEGAARHVRSRLSRGRSGKHGGREDECR